MKWTHIDTYICKEITLQTGVSLIAILAILLTGTVVEYISRIIIKGLPLSRLFYLILMSLPALLTIALPISYLFGVLVAFSRMGAESELIALRTLGWRVRRFFLPVLTMAFVTVGMTILFSAYLMPVVNQRLKKELIRIELTSSYSHIQERTFISDFPGYLLYVQDISPDRRTWHYPLLVDEHELHVRRVILAQTAVVHQPKSENLVLALTFKNGFLYETVMNSDEPARRIAFEEYKKILSTSHPASLSQFKKSDREMTIGELIQAIREREAKKRYVAGYKVELQKRFAFAFAPLFFAFIAFPFCVRPLHGSKFFGYFISIIFMLIAYVGILVGEKLGDQGLIHPIVAAWNPHILLLIIALPFYPGLEKPFSLPQFVRLKRLVTIFQKVTKRVSYRPKKVSPIRISNIFSGWPVFHILDRYIIRSWIFIFLGSSIVLLILYLIVEGFHLVDDLTASGAPMHYLFYYLFYAAPGIFHEILPLIAVMTSMIAIARLEKFREITAMIAHGMSYYRVLVPILIMFFLVSAFDYGLQEKILPVMQRQANVYKRLIKGLPVRTISTTRWAFGKTGYLYHFETWIPRTNRLLGFEIFRVDWEKWVFTEHCYAREASYQRRRAWLLRDVRCVVFEPKYRQNTYRKALLEVPETPSYFKISLRKPEEMSMGEIRSFITLLQKKGYRAQQWQVELAFKIIYPLSLLVLFPFAGALALKGARLGVAYGIVIALVLGFGHWVLAQLAKALGNVEALPPLTSAVLPFLITLFLGFYLFSRVRT